MAPARRARSPSAAQPVYIATDEESEPETPRPHKSNLKKRLSEVYHPDNDASFTSDNNNNAARPPLRAVNINDDAAEKRRRRKSTKLAVIENAMAGPSSEGMQDQEGAGAETGKGVKQKPLHTVAAPVINVSLDVMSSNFEEWMKMATDNKINAQNSWNFALIDYFHDMSLLRNDDDNSINFQRASCTLDGCVKIWTSRVDSVGTETGKLLSNLETGGQDDDEEGDNSDNPDADPTQPKKRKANRGTGATLAKDPATLKNKKPDLEFAVDPLFKKTSADFDEGGAGGLLMNHLSLGIGSEGCMRVIFDASDPMGKVEEEDVIEEPEDDVDLSYLRKTFLPDLSVLDHKEISHSLSEFAFSKNAINLNEITYLEDPQDDDDDNFGGDTFGLNVDAGEPSPVEDFFVGADAVNDDFGADMGGDDYGNDNMSNGSVGPMVAGEEARPGPFVPFDPRRLPNERDLILAMADPDAEGGSLDYFDQNILKNWAGPEHWKLKKVIRRPEGDAAANKPAKRQKKEAVKIDFMTPSAKDAKDLTKELFAPPTTKGAGINLPGTGAAAGKKGKKKKEKRDDHRLPDDMHFSSRDLVTLFLKPKFFLKMRGKRVRMNPNGDGEVDEGFWAQAAAEQGANREHDPDPDDSNDEPAPFNTQFFHEDDFGPGFDDDGGYDGEGGPMVDDAGEQDLLAATQGHTRRVKPETVNYTKRAKRVDVRKLKENIWKGLDIVIKNEPEDGDQSMDVDETIEPTDPTEARQFSQVITGLQRSYPRDKMEEISTSFCFICLLHLANEQGLKLESAAEDDPHAEKGLVSDEDQQETVSDDRKIGDIWDIKIYRDPTASQSA